MNEPEIGETERFRWHATAVGIAALWLKAAPPSTPPFEDAVAEGLKVGLDLSREEDYYLIDEFSDSVEYGGLSETGLVLN